MKKRRLKNELLWFKRQNKQLADHAELRYLQMTELLFAIHKVIVGDYVNVEELEQTGVKVWNMINDAQRKVAQTEWSLRNQVSRQQRRIIELEHELGLDPREAIK